MNHKNVFYPLNFNKPHLTGKETEYIIHAVSSGHISGNGAFTKKCHTFFEERYGFNKCLLTTSCTDALEMSAILINIKPDDEIIMPSFTFVSTALAFVRQGAKIVFADSCKDQPNMDETEVEKLITQRTKAIVVVHYAGVACNMDYFIELSQKYNLWLIEDAAQAIDSFYVNQTGQKLPLGSMGHLACFSFHETKNIQCGEGGMLVINHETFKKRAEIIWEKGTNRAAFWRGEVDKYGWVDTGSSFLPSDLLAAFLFAQLEKIDVIQQKRKTIWNLYYEKLKNLEKKEYIKLPVLPEYATNNAHMFYFICKCDMQRQELINFLKNQGIWAVFHYQSLHKSNFYEDKYKGKQLPYCDFYSNSLLRLPFYYDLSNEDINQIVNKIHDFFLKSH
ncbi:MAG: dTDP-4-amino-4,6-dideoxygalactose transaminase [Bacteroidales bacterium]|nr:dTDP-4-amino-4,6-dideoxygalactose transaminase [Bacteroidales bacterium]